MITTLYKNFQHWSNSGSIYIISDPHFGDTDMNWRWSLIKDYPFATLDWLDDNYIADSIATYIVWKINKTVHKNDTLIILGDIGNTKYVSQLKAGYKVLVKGNHDSGTENYLKRDYCGYPHCRDGECFNCKHYKEKLFDEVYNGPLFISKKILLSHEPIFGLEDICLNIHGHVHGNGISTDFSHFNCAIENLIGFIPINLKEFITSGRIKNIKGIHRITIDKASNKS